MTPRDRHNLAQAAEHLAAGRYDAALDLTRRVLRQHPDSMEARLLEARTQIARHRPGATLSALDAMELHHPTRRGRPDVAMLRVEALEADGNLPLALRQARRLAEAFPDDPGLHRTVGNLAMRLAESATAAAAWRQVVRLCPSDSQARRTLAELIEAEKPDEAVELLQSISDDTDLFRLAQLLVRCGRLREAEELFARLIARQPHDTALAGDAGAVADLLGDDAHAVDRLRRAGDLMALAHAHLHAGRLAAAGRTAWRFARGLPAHDSRLTHAWTLVMLCAVETEHDTLAEEARKYLNTHASRHERLAALAAAWPHVACGLAVGKARDGRLEVDMSPPSPLVSMTRRATATLRRHARRFPRRADTHYHLGACLAELGDAEQAEAAAGRALQLNPRYAEASRLALRVGRLKAAA